jgi:redox-sensitive bicupin YhaK (pirin superfamily)
LWIALPPHLELGAPISLYQGTDEVPAAGPARVLLGSYEGATSAIEAPSPMNYLVVELEAGARWRYQPPAGHTVLWMAIGKGVVMTSARLDAGEIAVFQPGTDAVDFVGQTGTDFVLGSAVPHDHDLVVGYYSVHTSREALETGETQIRSIGSRLKQERRL